MYTTNDNYYLKKGKQVVPLCCLLVVEIITSNTYKKHWAYVISIFFLQIKEQFM